MEFIQQAAAHFINGVIANINGLANNVSGAVSINITLDPTLHQKVMSVKRNQEIVVLPVYTNEDSISGQIQLQVELGGKQKSEVFFGGLFGYLFDNKEIFNESKLCTEFVLLSKELEPAGYLTANKVYRFKFSHFDKQYETFNGKTGRVRYFIRAVLARNVIASVAEEEQFAVLLSEVPEQIEIPIVLNVGVGEKLRIEFRLPKNCYHIKERIEGTVIFEAIELPVSRMMIELIRIESLGTLDSTTSKSKVLEKFQVMDGCPTEGDYVPFRMSMRGVKGLTPSYRSIHNRLFVRHWLRVFILDEQGHRYFQQAQIFFYRQ